MHCPNINIHDNCKLQQKTVTQKEKSKNIYIMIKKD